MLVVLMTDEAPYHEGVRGSGGTAPYFFFFFTSGLDGGEWSASRLTSIMGPDAMGKKKSLPCPCHEPLA